MCGRKLLRVNPTMYEATWKLMNKWLINLPIVNFLHVSPISPYVSSCLTYCFPSIFRCFPCFLWCFLLFPILGFMASSALSLRVLFPVWKWSAKIRQKIHIEQLSKVSKNFYFINFPFWRYQGSVIQRLKNEPIYNQTSQDMLLLISQVIQIKISFHDDNFRVDFFKDLNFVIFSIDFFSSVKFEHISWNYWN